MKKILAIFLMFVLIATSVSAVTITQKKEEFEADKFTEVDDENRLVNKYQPKPFPPKTKEQIEKMIVDPQPTVAAGSLPSQFSWKSYGGDWTTPAKDQGNCGSCWAFGALGAMEAAIDISSGFPTTNIDLSEQYILSCLGAAGDCGGGWMSTAIEYIMSTDTGSTGNGVNGCTIESCFPYQAKDYIPCDDKCSDWDYKTDPPAADNKLFEVLNYGVTSGNPNDPNYWDLLKSWVYDYGPLSVDIYASSGWNSFWSSHHSPNDVYEGTETYVTTHAQVLCGWVDDPDVYNGGYWILKNSWGTSWGYGGFNNVAYGCLQVGDRDVTWVDTPDWPYDEDEGGIPDVDMAVFSDFDYDPEYAHPDEEVEFTDISDGDVALRKWDFNGDGVIDSNKKHPTWTYSQPGEYEVTLEVWSEWGLHSNRTKIVEVKNNWPPVVEGLPNEFVGHGLSYHFDARYCYDPDGTITDYLWDFDDGTTSDEKYLDHSFPEGDVIYEVTLTLTDNDGGISSETCQLKIDQTVPPVTTINHGIGAFNSDWYSETQRISFSATDWTEVIDTFYRIDGGSWKRYVPAEHEYIPVGDEGEHTVEAYSVDYYGNEEDPVSETFGIDKTSPTGDLSLSGDFEAGQYIGSVTVTINGEDGLSGMDKIMYKLRGKTSWIDYSGPFELTESCSLEYVIVDNAGNLYEETVQIPVEGPPSVPSITGPTSGEAGQELKYTFKAIDVSPSSEDNIFFYIDWGDGDVEDWIGPYDSSEKVVLTHIFNEEKVFKIKAKAKDQLGAESDWGELTVSTPKSKNIDFPFLQKLLGNFPILKYLLQLLIAD